jgi:hypothetical protein
MNSKFNVSCYRSNKIPEILYEEENDKKCVRRADIIIPVRLAAEAEGSWEKRSGINCACLAKYGQKHA